MNRFEHNFWAVVAYVVIYYTVTGYTVIDQIVFWPGLFMVLIGAAVPDYDWDLGNRFHRSPITHGLWIPLLFFLFYLVVPPAAWVYEVIAWFFMGYASHLFLDNFPSHAGFFTILFKGLNLSYTPGDVRGVTEKGEYGYLTTSGIAITVMAVIFLLKARGILILGFIPTI